MTKDLYKHYLLSDEYFKPLCQTASTLQNLFLISYPVVSYFRWGSRYPAVFLRPAYLITLLLIVLMPLIYQFWRKRADRKEMQLAFQEKTDNPHLTAWKETLHAVAVPWYLLYILGTAILFCLTEPVSKSFFLFLLLAPVQYALFPYVRRAREHRLLTRNVLNDFYQKAEGAQDFSFLWPDYPCYGLLIRDDTNRIPVTFNRGWNRPDNCIFFDCKRDLEVRPGGRNPDALLPVYLHAKLFVYVLQASLYQDIRAELEKVLTFCRFQIRKPVYLFLLTEDASSLNELIRRYDWMPFVTIRIVSDLHSIDLDKCYEDTLTGVPQQYFQGFDDFTLPEIADTDLSQFFRARNMYSSYIYIRIPSCRDSYCFQANNYYLCGFFQHMFRSTERRLSILAGFDYVDMILRFVLYHFAVKKGLGFQPRMVDDDIQYMGAELLKLLDEQDAIHETAVRTTLPINETLRNALLILETYFPLKAEGTQINFTGLVTLLRILRNNTRGHGAIQDSIVDPLWYALYILFVILGDMLQISDFEIRLCDDGSIQTGYGRDGWLYPMGEYGMLSDHMPCPIYQIKGKKKEYINYFRGDFIVPHIISEPDEESP